MSISTERIEYALLEVTNDSAFYKFIIDKLVTAKEQWRSWSEVRKAIYNHFMKNGMVHVVRRPPSGNDELINRIISHYSEEAFKVHVPQKHVESYIFNNYVVNWVILKSPATPSTTPALTGDKPMQPKDIIERKVFIFNDDASELTDDQLFDSIAKVEKEIIRLESVKTQPKALATRIRDMKAALAEVVTFMDARNDG